uniref:Glycerol-3-phosphate dehydrogenase [NAD(+)] n=1 Tax=Phaeocystis antarctica TaxID=33657 RepID=A0A7S0EYM2_9EUKA
MLRVTLFSAVLAAASATRLESLRLRGGQQKEKVCIIGSGNWGSAIAKIVGRNVLDRDQFEDEVTMWVFQENVDGKNLTDIINNEHENVKYLPGVKFTDNVVADPDLTNAVQGATLLIFVLPHQFLGRICPQMTGMAKGCRAVSLIKGIEFKDSKPILISDLLAAEMKKGPNAPDVDMSVLMGANVANEVAKGDFAEATVGCTDLAIGAKWVSVFNTPDFKVDPVMDVAGAELCGALKNVVALGAGFCDGLGFGGNTKAAIIRIGLKETAKFAKMFFSGVQDDTFMESCGLADLVTTCFGGRNRKCADIYAKMQKAGTPKAWDVIETEELNGQKLQGTGTAKDVMTCIKAAGKEKDFPLMCQIYRIAFEDAKCETIIQINN